MIGNMTVEEWHYCKDPERMIDGRIYNPAPHILRRERLAACACARVVWSLLSPEGKDVVCIAEDFVEGGVTQEELKKADGIAWNCYLTTRRGSRDRDEKRQFQVDFLAGYLADEHDPLRGLTSGVDNCYRDFTEEDKVAFCSIIREVFGNPFNPIPPPETTPTVLAIAQEIYETRQWGELPVLADALEDYGGVHPDILEHLRGHGPHVRGCWALDLVLGRN